MLQMAPSTIQIVLIPRILSILSTWLTTPTATYSLMVPIYSTTTHQSITTCGMMINCTTNTIGISTTTRLKQ
jgi:hypothetical protein